MKKKVVIFILILSVFAGLAGYGESDKSKNSKESEVVSESVATETATEETTETATEEISETVTEVEHRTGDAIVGVSDKDISDLDPVFWKSVVNDVTGKWRYATISDDVNISDYVLSYYKEYFKSDDEVHAIINFANKTTTRINCGGDRLLICTLDYVDGEEHDAKKMFSGSPLESYCVYLDNGDIEKTE